MEKKQFVETMLSEAVKAATSWIARLEYQTIGYEELVTIVCNNGYTYKVCVTGDSKAAIIEDVIREVLRH